MTPSFTADCGHLIPELPDGHAGGTGYGTDMRGKTRCYECGAKYEAECMVRDGKATLYVIQLDHIGKYKITDWAGKLEFPAFNITRSHGWGFGRRYPIVTGRFTGPDGKLWCFRNAGDNQIARCKRLKDAR